MAPKVSDRQKRSISLKVLERAKSRLADTTAARDTTLGMVLKDLAKYHNEILADGSECLSESEIEAAVVEACERNGLADDTVNGGIAKVKADVPRCLGENQHLKVEDWEQRFDKTAENGSKPDDSDTATDTVPLLVVTDIEDGFWGSRRSLQDIYISALARMASPWSVLAFCAARALAQVRPHVTLPDVIGGPGSLNWFAAITATSGGGKGAASAVAKQLVTGPVQQRNTGSGEGIIRAYVRPKTDDEPAGLYESLMFVVDEIDSLAAQSKRTGTTTMPVLRGAFSGETLGFSYVNNNTPIIEAHSYRMTMVVSVQPARAASLLDDHGGGTPQRFMWFPGTDRRINAYVAGGFIDALQLPSPKSWLYPTTLDVPDDARKLIIAERVKAMQGQQDSLDGHALFCREKFAFALAVLDGRSIMSLEDWELAGIAAAVSDRTRDWVARAMEQAEAEEAVKRGTQQGIASAAADVSKSQAGWKRMRRIENWILAQLKAAGAKGMSKGELSRVARIDIRHAIVPVLLRLADEGVVNRIDRVKGDRSDRWALAQ